MLISVPELLTTTITLYWQNFRLIMRYLGLSLIIWILLALNSTIARESLTKWFGQIPGEITIIIAQILLLGAFVIATITLNRVLVKRYNGLETTTLHNEIKAAYHLFWPFLGISFLAGIIVFGGSLLLIIPGAIFAVWYYFAPYEVMLDNAKVFESLRLSKKLVTGRWGAVLWRLGLPIVIYIAFFSTINWFILTPGKLFLMSTGSSGAYWLSIALAIIFYFFFVPIITITPIILYENLKKNPVQIRE